MDNNIYKQTFNGNPGIGRINNLNKNYGPDYKLFDDTDYKYDTTHSNGIQGIHCSEKLNKVYFSKENINRLQDLIRYTVYIKSNKQHIIDRQSDTELQIVMRGIFLEYGRNLPDNISEQIKELDKYILNYCVTEIINEINQYKDYIHHAENLPIPLEHPKNLSSAGSRTLRSVTSTF
jgi:hypothetical protein